MSERAFFDTNILLYMYDRRDPVKQERALSVFRSCVDSRSLVISTQVVQEFYVAVTKKLAVSGDAARELVADLCDLEVIGIETTHILRATRLEQRYRLSFWDALIVSAAESAQASILYTEDHSNGQKIGRIQVRNPLIPHS
ncbi:PilT domain-containing protein [Candidatus Sulfopaludibacter sp. SbA3]|nr:PilT domain-containing protein [Candidatus Sulfopaludibacter sp. SbA3]